MYKFIKETSNLVGSIKLEFVGIVNSNFSVKNKVSKGGNVS